MSATTRSNREEIEETIVRHIIKFYGLPAVVVMYSAYASAMATPPPSAPSAIPLPLAEGGLLAVLTLSVMGGIWLARRKR